MNKLITAFYSFFTSIKATIAVAGSILWLCALAAWIYFCPQYIPESDYLLFSSFDSLPRKEVQKGQLIIEPWHDIARGVIWEAESGYKGSAGIKLLSDGETSSYLKWTLANPQKYSFLEFRGKMRTENIVVGENEWNAARFLVYFTDIDGKGRWDYPHEAVRLLGSHPWQEYSKIFPVPGFAVTANVFVQNNSKSGTIWCDEISLRPLYLNSAYFFYKNGLSVSGILLGIFLIFATEVWKNGRRIIFVLLATIILGVVCSNVYLEMLAKNLSIDLFAVKKIGHFILFSLLGFLSIRWLNERLQTHSRPAVGLTHAILTLCGLLIFAAITEFIQFLTIDRDPSIIDFLIDMIGILAGISIGCVVKRPNHRQTQ